LILNRRAHSDGRNNGPVEPLRLGGIALANRIAVSPVCQHSAENRRGERRRADALINVGARIRITKQLFNI
jgi:2,4-dienoyl-CoA reductase-like NADH-dependent reductase (Old Yellow Enzyme family)